MEAHPSPSEQTERTKPNGLSYDDEERARRMKEVPERLRPREVMERLGPAGAPDDVLIAVLLSSGAPGLNVADLATRMLRHYGTLNALARAPLAELTRFRGIGPVKALKLKAALQLGRNLHEELMPDEYHVRTPGDVARVLRDRVQMLDAEVFWCLHVDRKNRLKGAPVEITRGLLDASLVHPREVFREAVRSAVASVVLAHNHPSGDPAPSAEDVRITRQLIDAGAIMDIRVLDHVIVCNAAASGGPGFLSMREAGILNFG